MFFFFIKKKTFNELFFILLSYNIHSTYVNCIIVSLNDHYYVYFMYAFNKYYTRDVL